VGVPGGEVPGMRRRQGEPAKVLTIAGSDSGGAAGLQADLKTFAALGVYGMSVVTAVTAQNSVQVVGVETMTAEFVDLQIQSVLADYGATAVKTGFIGRVDLIKAIAAKLAQFQQPNAVIDPVLVNHRGVGMFSADVVRAYVDYLFPLSVLVTPNRQEADLLAGQPVEGPADMATAARSIHALGPQYVLITGGRSGDEAVDVLFDGHEALELRAPWIQGDNTHGSGDTLSAAVTAFLARGADMVEAVHQAHRFTSAAIQGAANWHLGRGHGPVNHWGSGTGGW
jgi:hydroxymethylpyrimidine/phosphomethylpyrimidine kinase